MPDSLEAGIQALTLFEQEYGGVEVLGALINQDYDETGALVNVIDVSWRIRGRPGMFTTSVPNGPLWVADAEGYIFREAALVNLIYMDADSGESILSEVPLGTRPPVGSAVPV